MKIIRIGVSIVILLIAACTTAKVVMKVDPSLERNAQVYEVMAPGKFTDARLNVSFGDYHVAGADTKRMKTRDPSAPDGFWLRTLFRVFEKWGLSTSSGGKMTEVYTSHTYQFKSGDEIAWDAKCNFTLEKREVKEVNNAIITNQPDVKVSTKAMSSHYNCRYTALDHEPWVLSIEWWRGDPEAAIKMARNDEHFEATVTAGEYVAGDGRSIWGKPADPGYTWTRDHKSIGAVSVGEKPPRVWLHKDNSASTNHALSMASAGLIIYYREIVPALKRD